MRVRAVSPSYVAEPPANHQPASPKNYELFYRLRAVLRLNSASNKKKGWRLSQPGTHGGKGYCDVTLVILSYALKAGSLDLYEVGTAESGLRPGRELAERLP